MYSQFHVETVRQADIIYELPLCTLYFIKEAIDRDAKRGFKSKEQKAG